MQFGLWFEPEMVNPDSDVAAPIRNGSWRAARVADGIAASAGAQPRIPGAYAHVKGQILALLDEYAIGYVKWDHNRDLIEAGNHTDGGRPGVHVQTLAFYRLLDEIREAHPDLEIESCSSGGARIDLAVVERTDGCGCRTTSTPMTGSGCWPGQGSSCHRSSSGRTSPRGART